MTKRSERYIAFAFGVVFIIVLLLLAIAYPRPTPFQYEVFKIVLALAAGGVAAMIPGFLTITVSTWLRAGGALAVFAVVFFYSPAQLTGVEVKTEQETSIEEPILQGARPSSTLPELVVTRPDQLSDPGVLAQRYKTVKIDGVSASVPPMATLVANEIEGLRGGALVGREFSIVARRLANTTIDVSRDRESERAGVARLYVKTVENTRILANGAAGQPGKAGERGADGADGAKGRDGSCKGFGGYHGAAPGSPGADGGNGRDGQPGEDGQAGGLVVITTIVNPVGSSIDVSGGQGGAGGAGGDGGTFGRGGAGGRGCTGLGGSQPNEADGPNGKPGHAGQQGPNGRSGADGEYRLQIFKSFDPIVQILDSHSNEGLHVALSSL